MFLLTSHLVILMMLATMIALFALVRSTHTLRAEYAASPKQEPLYQVHEEANRKDWGDFKDALAKYHERVDKELANELPTQSTR